MKAACNPTPERFPPPGGALPIASPAEHERWMSVALTQARTAAEDGEVPVGAVIVRDGRLIAKAFNQVERLKDPTAHAEILAITQAAAALGDWRLTNTVLYVTKEPCVMCAGAIVLARIPYLVWGVTDSKRGGAVSCFNACTHPSLNHRPHLLHGVLEEECRTLLRGFFQDRRQTSAP